MDINITNSPCGSSGIGLDQEEYIFPNFLVPLQSETKWFAVNRVGMSCDCLPLKENILFKDFPLCTTSEPP